MQYFTQTDERKDILRIDPGANGIQTLGIDTLPNGYLVLTVHFLRKPAKGFFPALTADSISENTVTVTGASPGNTGETVVPSNVQLHPKTGNLIATFQKPDQQVLQDGNWWILRLNAPGTLSKGGDHLDRRLSTIRFHFGSPKWNTVWNGIDRLEVEDDNSQPMADRQRHLHVFFVNSPLPAELTAKNMIISGGERITDIRVDDVIAHADFLEVVVNKRGDFSIYRLSLVEEGKDTPPEGIDPLLSSIQFSFKVGCPNDFDCKAETECPPEKIDEPDINYLAKDYASFRRLMLDRLRVLMPDWRENNPADMQVALVEALAYTADHLSYYQDAVATEAYLGTARKRISVRRHARLLDYFMHDGCNAKTWLFLEALWDGIIVNTQSSFSTVPVASKNGMGMESTIFETMHPVTLYVSHNRIPFYRWSGAQNFLLKGTTHATLDNTDTLYLKPGDLLLFEEVVGLESGEAADADRLHRHVVRLTKVEFSVDPINGTPVCEIDWSREDALPFSLCLHAVVPFGQKIQTAKDISIARGNIVTADHGTTVNAGTIKPVKSNGKCRASLPDGPLTFQGCVRDVWGKPVTDADGRRQPINPNGAAAADARWLLADARPAIFLKETDGDIWDAQYDLLNSDSSAREFVVECDEAGLPHIRFGDGIMGKEPPAELDCTYRIGNGRAGNVAAETITVAPGTAAGIAAVRNPLPAGGGTDPESMEEVRQYAPQAFRVQERAVTAEDWAEVAQRHPEVQKAVARFRWTGSWLTVFVSIDRYAGAVVDAAFKKNIRMHLERYRLAGFDLEINGPMYVPLDVSLHVCVKPGFVRTDVEERLLRVFSNRDLQDGTRGLFHPDNFTFAQPVFLSQIFQAALAVEGVARVDANTFKRWGKEANNEMDDGYIKPGMQEIIRLDNDTNFRENGKMDFVMEGGI